ncbi:MAG: hypothetical protein WKF91_12830, partial [Segetibacter sp.]
MAPKIYPGSVIISAVICVFALFNQASAQVHVKALQSIQLLEQEKASRTFVERKIDSRLLQAVREKRGRKMAEGVVIESPKLLTDDKGNIEVDIRADVSDRLLSEIKTMGGRIIFSSMQFHSIRVEVNVATAEKIAGLSAVKFVQPAAIP